LHFAKLAEAAGHRITALQSNITDAAALEAEVLTTDPDWVIHFAGISFVASKDDEAFYRVHALGSSNLLASLSKLRKKPVKVLLASSATVYGNSNVAHASEDQQLNPIDHYAMSKVAMEEMAKTFMDRLPIIIARPFNYTGPGQKGNFLIPKLIAHFTQKNASIELGNLNVEREFNDINMICEAYLNLLQYGTPAETYNVGSGNARSLKQVIDTLIQMTGHAIEVKVNPDFVRANEVRRMCADPAKLNALFQAQGIQLNVPPLEYTLQRMLQADKS
jgi:nucleoside-diphosphate-sugar epimerase